MTDYDALAKSAYNKQQAIKHLTATDWVELPSIRQVNISPFLCNFAEFSAYRRGLRRIAIDPPDEDIVWPIKPKAAWS